MDERPRLKDYVENSFERESHGLTFLTFNRLPNTIYELPALPLCNLLSRKTLTDDEGNKFATKIGLTTVCRYRELVQFDQTLDQLPGMERLSVPGSNPEFPDIDTVNLDKQAIETAVVLCAHSRIGVKQSESSESKEERLLMQAEPKNENT